jgi:hypothetical protein
MNYTDSMTSLVESFKKMYPEKYKKAQLQGDEVMNSSYSLTVGQDSQGEKLKLDQLLLAIKNYKLTKEDLTKDELELLEKNKESID